MRNADFGILHFRHKVVYTFFHHSRFGVSGFSVQVSVFRFQVSGFRFQVSDLAFLALDT